MRGDSPLWGVLTGSPLPETVLNVYSAFQEGSLNFILGVGWGWGVSWAWSGDNTKCRSGSTAVDGFWGCQVRDAGNIVLQKYILIPICTLNKYAGRAQVQVTKVTCYIGVVFFSGCLISIPEEDKHGARTSDFPLSWQMEVLTAPGAGGWAPHGPTLPF